MSPGRSRRAALLDVNVLIALAWPNHAHHGRARRWFEHHHRSGWATTPVSESGFVRVSSNRAAIATATTPELALELLRQMTALPGHEFWIDDLRLVTDDRADASLMISHRDVTDAHLLAVAERHGGRLVTFDSRIARLLGARDKRLLDVLDVSVEH